MKLEERLQLERKYHESEDTARSGNSIIRNLYDSGLFGEAEEYQLDALGDIRDACVLDYGCGGGWSTAKLQQRGAHVIGFDISQVRLNEAQGHTAANNGAPAAGFALCAAEALPFADASFDAVFGKQVLHHLQLEEALPHLARVLRPGGKAVFLEPLIHNPLLEGYRRLTPHLRSPTERALSMRDVERIGSYFRHWTHQEFCLLSVAPALIEAATRRTRLLTDMRDWLSKVDHTLIRAMPPIGRYCWETVIIVER